MLEIINKSKCCGCSACASVCPIKCIIMKRDEEGFQYPFVDKKLCVSCGLCEIVCPEINGEKEVYTEQEGYIVQIKDKDIRLESTSGGVFTAIAQQVLSKGGVVFGAAFEDNVNYRVRHQYVEIKEDLWKFRGSKYVQSVIGNTYSEAKTFLDKGKLVCFSGTPCQIEGLKRFLINEYENLITVDIVCRAVPSPLVFEKYLELQTEILGSAIMKLHFRDKFFGYKYSTMNLYTFKNRGNYHRGIESDPWLRAFFSGICNRPSCHHCSFKKRYRVSDFTIWDCFNVRRFSVEMDDDMGTTRVLIHSDKGRAAFKEIRSNIIFLELNPNELVEGTKEMFESSKPNTRRTDFFSDLNVLNAFTLFNKYFPSTIRVKFERAIRLLMYKLGLYKSIKRVYEFIKNTIKFQFN